MARESLILLLMLAGCSNYAAYEGAFDVPVATAWLDRGVHPGFHGCWDALA